MTRSSKSMPEPLIATNSQELTDLLELTAVDFLEVYSAREKNEPPEEADTATSAKINMVPGLSEDGLKLGVIVTANVTREEFSVRVRIEVVYDSKVALGMPEEDVISEFLGTSTLLTVGPYIRESVGSLLSRIGVQAPMFPLMKPSVLEPDFDETASGEGDQQ